MEAVIGSIPRSIDEPNSTSADEASREGENSNVISGSTSTQANDSASVRLHHKDISKVYTRRKFRPQPEATDLIPDFSKSSKVRHGIRAGVGDGDRLAGSDRGQARRCRGRHRCPRLGGWRPIGKRSRTSRSGPR